MIPNIHPEPQPWTYVIRDLNEVGSATPQHPMFQKQTKEPKFSLVPTEDYVLPEKVYGTILEDARMIIETFLDRKGISTGALFTGEKGGGKTLLMKAISIIGREYNLPTYIINKPYAGDAFNEFLQKDLPPGIIDIDEFEKTYSAHHIQQKLLTILDGVIPTHKLWILTCNNKYGVDQRMINRPGRLYYYRDYSGLPKEDIVEYCEDNLFNPRYTKEILEIASLFKHFTFDMTKAVVEEVNRQKRPPKDVIKFLNVKPENASSSLSYSVSIHTGTRTISGSEINGNTMLRVHPKLAGNPMNFGYKNDAGEFKQVIIDPAQCIMKSSDDNSKIYAQAPTGEVVIFERHEIVKQDLMSMDKATIEGFDIPDELKNVAPKEESAPQPGGMLSGPGIPMPMSSEPRRAVHIPNINSSMFQQHR